jgi:hypothetical protein
MRPSNAFDHLAGAEVRYDRRSREHYGTRGVATRFRATPAFEETLQAAFADLWDACPLGRAEVIASGGAFADKPGAHGRGRAFDLDALFWPERAFVALSYPHDRRFYLAVEAVLRGHLGTVLNYRYNAAHRDHLHLDDLTPRGFVPEHRSRVLFLQMALTHLFGRRVAIDGRIGPETRGAARDLLAELELAGSHSLEAPQALDDRLGEAWPEVLDAATQRGFADAGGESGRENGRPAEEPPTTDAATPLTLLRRVYRTLDEELGGTAARAEVEAAVRSFAGHKATAAWLDQFRPDEDAHENGGEQSATGDAS